ncbi:hypothetical protein ACIO1C_06685 [Streptomyces sp. NPDC087420]|uniref:hypothetical protein n=1 Tax=Streptomyces sp. NPDC087420 TaxID=3365785 RepID=UPI003832797F
MGNDGDGGVPVPQDRLAMLLGDLLIELGQKVQQAGVDGVRILTDEEVIRDQVRWYRTGWAEHARAAGQAQPSAAGHPDMEDFPVPAGRLLRFPDQSADTEPATPAPDPPGPSRASETPEARDGLARPHSPLPGDPESPPGPESPLGPESPPASQAQRLPLVGAGDANVRNLMPHRPRHRRAARERGDEG